MAFETKGDVAEWVQVYRDLQTLAVGDVIKYADLTGTLGRDFLENRGPLYRATRELQENESRTLEVVQSVGYRVVAANEHMRLASKEHRSAKRKLRKSMGIVKSADRSQLTTAERVELDNIQIELARQQGETRRLSARQERTERAVASLTSAHDQAQADTAARLARLEAALIERGLVS